MHSAGARTTKEITMKKWFLLCLPVALVAAGAAYAAHARLTKSAPEDGSVNDMPPPAFVLEFSESVTLHDVYIKKDNDKTKPLHDVPHGDAKAVTIPAPALAAGHYVLEWSAFTHENTVLSGRIRFEVSAASAAAH
jgi:methionine-rich copper-binding protein CopC